jgi:hypothetical protein
MLPICWRLFEGLKGGVVHGTLSAIITSSVGSGVGGDGQGRQNAAWAGRLARLDRRERHQEAATCHWKGRWLRSRFSLFSCRRRGSIAAVLPGSGRLGPARRKPPPPRARVGQTWAPPQETNWPRQCHGMCITSCSMSVFLDAACCLAGPFCGMHLTQIAGNTTRSSSPPT